jgi:hypothetical protein
LDTSVFIITPPFTQLNTPYPASAYIKGFLNTQNIQSHQADLGIDVINALFSKEGFEHLFRLIERHDFELSENAHRMVALKADYIKTIDAVIRFLQKKDSTLAHNICESDYLPEAGKFSQLEDLDWAFGSMGIQDKARHFATLYLEDIADLIKETVDPHFGFSRYAERLGESATDFDELHKELQAPNTFIDELLINILEQKIIKYKPSILCISVPFPGNLYGALKCGQYIKSNHPQITVCMGGGYPNTELRSLKEERVFEYVDFITLDDGERPLLSLIEYLNEQTPIEKLKRTFTLTNGEVTYYDSKNVRDFPFAVTGTPDYSDLELDNYLSVIEMANPMHRLWSDGRWNKMTLAHGCYWGKCSFCDISLDYIKNYEPVTPEVLCDRIESIITQTGESGFHFVDEAAPPALMRDLALEIIRREITITWWTNIRFEQSFTADLCKLLKASGCIAVSGGLEVASDRLLSMMKKGVTIDQVAQVAHNFTQSDIMVHAYLMYGFPTQTAQETIDSLEIVRQLFLNGIVQSAFWHQFAMTAHSPIGLDPEVFGVQKIGPKKGKFAENDYNHSDPNGANHIEFSEGLRKSLFNYMYGVCFDFELYEWFDFDTPETTIPPNQIELAIQGIKQKKKENFKVIWLGNQPITRFFEKKKKGKMTRMVELIFHNKKAVLTISTTTSVGEWLKDTLLNTTPTNNGLVTLQELSEGYKKKGLGEFKHFTDSHVWKELLTNGLILL